ncbi:MAG TPA: aldo/keto reductase, partial [Anaerolineales bacterium]|nr:aldo/keto reductase [Anaerolineales bacterium]
MNSHTPLGRSELRVPRLGVGVMTWGEARGLARLQPAKAAYGGAENADEERCAFEASVAAGANLFDTAAMYSGGASERRLGELARGSEALIASKFPGSFFFRAEDLPRELAASLARLGVLDADIYGPSIPRLMGLLADAVAAGTIRAVGVSNYSAEQMRLAHAALADRGIPLASNQVEYSLLHRQPETNGVLEACREPACAVVTLRSPQLASDLRL